MILFFKKQDNNIYALSSSSSFNKEETEKLEWLFGGAKLLNETILEGKYIAPRKEMISPWSTNAVEITQNMGLEGIDRIEEFIFCEEGKEVELDPMIKTLYTNPSQDIFINNKEPEEVIYIDNISEYNKQEGLALADDEIEYLEEVSKKIDRKLTDGEVFGFSQVNSEHCRHKIFNGTFIIDGKEQPLSLFQHIKRTSKENHNLIVSAYKDNVAFIKGAKAMQFAPKTQYQPDFFELKEFNSVISLKAETHNFPTTVEPFNGAATGTGGEIRDRMAGGKGSVPIAGTAVYMTAYPRLDNGRSWEKNIEERKWLYQTPADILIKASNGASDFGNKFGQPLICGSVLTFEHEDVKKMYGYDKVIMLAGGIGYGKEKDALKDTPQEGNKIVVMGGDNYRIGMGGGAVSSVATGEFSNAIELNAVQRANPEMQKRVCNAIRAMVEMDENPVTSIHDHGAGGHLNSLTELVEDTGGFIDVEKLPIGDKTLSSKEIIGNESQERMGLVINDKDIDLLQKISDRERSPMYVVGEATNDKHFTFNSVKTNPIDLPLDYLFGKPPKTIIEDKTINIEYPTLSYNKKDIQYYIEQVLQIEAVACKDWLTNKVDRSVTGRIATQQCAGSLQLPLNNLGVAALDYVGYKGIATSIGHTPIAGIINAANGAKLSLAESLTNIIFAPLTHGIKGISLSANWMWACKNEGEDAKLYKAVEAISQFAIDLGINIPTGKDSLSMKQKYTDGKEVFAPGTVIVSACAEVEDIRKTVSPVIINKKGTKLIHVSFTDELFNLGGSSFAQTINQLGDKTPSVNNTDKFVNTFTTIQELIKEGLILSGHDISAGGMVTALLEMLFAENNTGLNINLDKFGEEDIIKILFAENPSLLLQTSDYEKVASLLNDKGISFNTVGEVSENRELSIKHKEEVINLDVNQLRDLWFKTSYLLDAKQSGEVLAKERYNNYKEQELDYKFSPNFTGQLSQYNLDKNRKQASGIKAAIIREKGVNGDREMAYSMYLAGLDVKDVHVTDLINGRETLEDINFIVFVGGFSNSDVLGSAKGWAGALLYNDKARTAIENFYKREDTLSLGVCNGCQLMVELGFIYKQENQSVKMLHNDSHKFESNFVNVDIKPSNSVMLSSLEGNRLGVWIAHGEGKFEMPNEEANYHIPMKYSYSTYPANPNGSDFGAAAICSNDGRHLAMMPHLERSIFSWQWANSPQDKQSQEITPWVEAFVNAKKWIENR